MSSTPKQSKPRPRHYLGVTISSTFTDLKDHRAALIKVINANGMTDVAMENDSAKLVDVIESSLQMVSDGSAYIVVIGKKYGQTPECTKRNPDKLSITEIEFNEALALRRPILLFLMGKNHLVHEDDIEIDPAKREKLAKFRERAKKMGEDISVHRVYATFESLDDFKEKIGPAIADLRRYLEQTNLSETPAESKAGEIAQRSEDRLHVIPKPPAFYARPSYIGSHSFVGRASQLETLSDWASPADAHSLLLYEAIGGTGKSMLTWEWAAKHATLTRGDWVGRFWYSFYERGATMVDFCRRALVYMTGEPYTTFRESNTAELTEPLIQQLQSRPWLIVIDGLERVLVSYHRFDAAQLPDEQAGLSDKIVGRDPCAAINPEDEDLLRALTSALPSKLLITSRLVPRALLNQSGQPIPGVLREHLPGLRPADAEALIRSCGVTGSSQKIQDYLKAHCDCHPLVIGVLAGLITDYLPDKGNFDAWVGDPNGGEKLNLANLDLVQKRNHILSAALLALPELSRKLLSTLALLSESVDYATLVALNPALPPIPESVGAASDPSTSKKWKTMSEEQKEQALKFYQESSSRFAKYNTDLKLRKLGMEAAKPQLAEMVNDLERRGLIQYDHLTKRYDLHPVVRGIAAGRLQHEEKNQYGKLVVDHFSQQAHNPYNLAETLDDFDDAKNIVKALFQMGRDRQAKGFLRDGQFLFVLNRRFEAHNEILSLIRPFFSKDWNEAPLVYKQKDGKWIANTAAICLRRIGAFNEAFTVTENALKAILQEESHDPLCFHLLNLSSTAGELNKLALEDRLVLLAGNDSEARKKDLFAAESFLLARFRQLSKLGRFDESDKIWEQIQSVGLSLNAQSVAMHHFALNRFFRDILTDECLVDAELKSRPQSAIGIRNLCGLRGFWHLEKKEWNEAKESLQLAVTLAHKAGKVDRRSEMRLALAKHKLGELPELNQLVDQFSQTVEDHCHRQFAELLVAAGDQQGAKHQTLLAYTWAWADGEPYVHRYELTKSADLLKQLGVQTPQLVRYDSSADKTLPLEGEIAKAIGKIQSGTNFSQKTPKKQQRST